MGLTENKYTLYEIWNTSGKIKLSLPIKYTQQLGPAVKRLQIYTPRTKTGRKEFS
jgi:hypothetical protein